MKRKVTIAIVLVVVGGGVLAGIKVRQFQTLIAFGKSYVPPPETVATFDAREETWQTSLTAIGSITAAQGVTVTPELPGSVREIAFESGAMVAQGDVLVRLDTTSEAAQLRAVAAQQEWDAINLKRLQNLRKENTVSQAELDVAEIAAKTSLANADNIRTVIEKKTIRAPFAGRLGIRQVNLGQYLDTAKPIVSLQALATVHGDFSLPQQNLSQIRTGMKVRVTTDAYPGKKFTGELTAINPELDAATRSVGLQATFENADQLLRPGMYVRFEVVLPADQKVLAIPGTAILSAPYGDSVYAIESAPATTNGAPAGLVVRQKFVRIGRSQGDYVSVESGLKPGERIVNSGVFKLRNGMSVIENNETVPKSADKPKPSDS